MNRLDPNQDDEARAEVEDYFKVSMAELDKEMQLALEFVKKMAADHPKGIMPQLVVVGARENEDGSVGEDERGIFAIATDFNEGEDKEAIMIAVGNSCVNEGKLMPKLAVFISEAWRAQQHKDDSYVRPAHHPNRVEQIIVMGMTAHKMTLFYGIPILRNSDNGIHLALDELERAEGGECFLLCNFFTGVCEAIAKLKKDRGI